MFCSLGGRQACYPELLGICGMISEPSIFTATYDVLATLEEGPRTHVAGLGGQRELKRDLQSA